MSTQLTIFHTGIGCWHCGLDPGWQEANSALWAGFFDTDLDLFCCNKCKHTHYTKKKESEWSGCYSETPVVIETELLRRKLTTEKS